MGQLGLHLIAASSDPFPLTRGWRCDSMILCLQVADRFAILGPGVKMGDYLKRDVKREDIISLVAHDQPPGAPDTQ